MSILTSLIKPATAKVDEMGHEVVGAAVSRRRLMKRAGALAGAVAVLGGSQLAVAAGSAPALEFEVACDGGSFWLNRRDPGATISPGDTFIVSGRIYPSGTIAQGLSGPHQAGSIGTWIHRGWFYYGFEEIFAGAAPHIISTQSFLFDTFDGLTTDGTEGGQFVVRPITGGYGMYRDARGVSKESEVGENETVVDLGNEILIPAPNLRFTFELDQ